MDFMRGLEADRDMHSLSVGISRQVAERLASLGYRVLIIGLKDYLRIINTNTSKIYFIIKYIDELQLMIYINVLIISM